MTDNSNKTTQDNSTRNTPIRDRPKPKTRPEIPPLHRDPTPHEPIETKYSQFSNSNQTSPNPSTNTLPKKPVPGLQEDKSQSLISNHSRSKLGSEIPTEIDQKSSDFPSYSAMDEKRSQSSFHVKSKTPSKQRSNNATSVRSSNNDPYAILEIDNLPQAQTAANTYRSNGTLNGPLSQRTVKGDFVGSTTVDTPKFDTPLLIPPRVDETENRLMPILIGKLDSWDEKFLKL